MKKKEKKKNFQHIITDLYKKNKTEIEPSGKVRDGDAIFFFFFFFAFFFF